MTSGTLAPWFRVLLILHFVSNVVAGFAAVPEHPGTGAMAEALGLASILFVLGDIVCLVGLFLFRKWSRPLAVVITGVGFLLTALLPPVPVPAWSNMLNSVGAACLGAIIVLAYFSDLRHRFAT